MFKVILSVNEDPKFIDFLELVSLSWRKFFPSVEIELGFISDRNENDPYIINMKKYCNVHIFKPMLDIPLHNLAKAYRWLVACKFDSEICMINDLDLIPLQKKYTQRLFDIRKKDYLLCVGADVYRGSIDDGKFPSGYMMAESYVFKKVINPNNLTEEEVLRSWKGLKIYDDYESISHNNAHGEGVFFSDESLIRALISISKYPNIQYEDRGFTPFVDSVSRGNWKCDVEKLYNEEYIESHMPRPYLMHREELKILENYIRS